MILRLLIALASLIVSSFILFWGMVLLKPEWLFSGLRSRAPEVLYAIDTQEPVVALTIDDGPDPEASALILDTLAEHDARATFFLLGERIPGNEAVIQRMVDEGHELGNHMCADEPSIRLSIEEFESQLLQVDEMLSQYADSTWFRPGSGWYNDEMLAVLKENDYRCALGSVYPYDPQLGSAWFSIRYVLWKVKPGDVIVLHDYQARGKRTAKALQSILPELARRGYRVVTLTELYELGESPD